MKRIDLAILLIVLVLKTTTQYQPVNNGSSVQFKVKNFGIDVGGSFTGLQGNLNFDKNKPAEASFDVSIDASTVNTNNDLRDSHLKGATYFDVKNYPHIRFVSSEVTSVGKPGMFLVKGNLTIKNQTKPISFPFTATPTQEGYVFKGQFIINRRDFGVGGLSIISDNVDVLLQVLARK